MTTQDTIQSRLDNDFIACSYLEAMPTMEDGEDRALCFAAASRAYANSERLLDHTTAGFWVRFWEARS